METMMARKRTVCLFLAFLCLLLPTSRSFGEDRYIAVTSDVVNVRAEPSITSPIVAKAVRGDIFQVISEEDDWYGIALFSGESRYLYKPITRMTAYETKLPKEKAAIKRIYWEVVLVEIRALDEAAATCSGEVGECVRLEQLLRDKYTLQLFHKFGLQPPCYHRLIIEAAKDGISP